jgi:hypothetical protein
MPGKPKLDFSIADNPPANPTPHHLSVIIKKVNHSYPAARTGFN